jgi:phage portal protein BeeE
LDFEGKNDQSVTTSLDLFKQVYGSRLSDSGIPVTWKTALTVSTVLACCRVRAEGMSQVPFRLYQETAAGERSRADIRSSDHQSAAERGRPASNFWRRSASMST